MPEQKDQNLDSFLGWAKTQTNFPASSDPNIISEAIYTKLNHQMTQGFQKCLMIYSTMPNNEIPVLLLNDEKKMLRALNRCAELQSQDLNYKEF
jgi:hypothetical protein